MRSIKELAAVTDPAVARAAGMVRRMIVTLHSAKAIWQLTGFRQLDGSNEVVNAEVFSGVGLFARPAANGAPETIVLMVGDGKVPVAIATRDEKTRAAIANALELGADETVVHNSAAVVYLRADGTIEARTPSGAAVPLALKSDVQAVADAFNVHIHASGSGPTEGPLSSYDPGPPPVPTPMVAPDPVGTSVLRGE